MAAFEEDYASPPSQPEELSASFVDDITIPDGSELLPSTPFTKTWRIVNDGSVPFPPHCRLMHMGEAELGCPAGGVAVRASPGEVIDVTVPLVAPRAPAGRYMGYWRLETPGGIRFGHRLWVDIVVGAEEARGGGGDSGGGGGGEAEAGGGGGEGGGEGVKAGGDVCGGRGRGNGGGADGRGGEFGGAGGCELGGPGTVAGSGAPAGHDPIPTPSALSSPEHPHPHEWNVRCGQYRCACSWASEEQGPQEDGLICPVCFEGVQVRRAGVSTLSRSVCGWRRLERLRVEEAGASAGMEEARQEPLPAPMPVPCS